MIWTYTYCLLKVFIIHLSLLLGVWKVDYNRICCRFDFELSVNRSVNHRLSCSYFIKIILCIRFSNWWFFFLNVNFNEISISDESSCSLVLWQFSKTDLLLRPLALYDLNLYILLIKDLYNPFVLAIEFLFLDAFKWKFMLSWEFSVKTRFVVTSL